MNSQILNDIGLGSLDIGIVLIALAVICMVLLILTIVLMVRFSRLSGKYKKFMQGNTARSLEEDIVRLYEDMKYLKQSSEKNRKDILVIFRKLTYAFQKIGLVKYDAFNQMGGQLSFCLTLLDEENSGFLLNSVHSTEGCYTYTKEVHNGSSNLQLSEEEKQALAMAMKTE